MSAGSKIEALHELREENEVSYTAESVPLARRKFWEDPVVKRFVESGEAPQFDIGPFLARVDLNQAFAFVLNDPEMVEFIETGKRRKQDFSGLIADLNRKHGGGTDE